jgi:hypothetical protein
MVTGLPMIDVAYDTETYPNLFSCCVMPIDPLDDTVWDYEISERRNDAYTLVYALKSGYWRRMYGFHSLNFDSPIVHALIKMVEAGIIDAMELCRRLKAIAQEIVASGNAGNRFHKYRVHWKDEVAKQVDLALVHHFDNHARKTSLKALEFNMRSRRVLDMPIHHETVLTREQIPIVLDYGRNDTGETKRFVIESRDMIEFRDKLGPKHLNDNDTKIGKSFFISALEARSPGICYGPDRKPRQTWRATVPLADCILPWITFERPETRAVLERLKATTLRPDEIKTGETRTGEKKVETKGIFKDLTATVDGFMFVYGTGGLHGSVKNRIVRADKLKELVDIDVEAFYPSIAIENKVYPEHLGPGFVDVYRELKNDRVEAKRIKDFVKSDALKLANNGVYGDSNNVYGPFYDPKYTMTITLNGQLMLTMLAEQLLKIPGLEIIQANTDGMTLLFPRSQRARFDAICQWWQRGTAMKLEEKQYETMWIRDVNSYIARYSQDPINKDDRGKHKRKGAYDYEMKVGNQKAWWRDHSGLIIKRAAEAALCDDIDPRDYIVHHNDPWDFLMRERVSGESRLELADGTPCQQTTRYYVAHDGQPLIKWMPPLAKDPEHWRRQQVFAEGQATMYGPKKSFRCSICGDHGPSFKFKYEFDEHNTLHHTFKVKVCNVFNGGDLPGLNFDYYVKETEKLLLT